MLFAPYPESRWPLLKHFAVQYLDESMDNVRYYQEGMLEEIVLLMTPILDSADILRFTISGKHFTLSGL